MKISVVVSTYNRSGKLRLALEALSEQTEIDRAQYEVIVIDNNSSDDTKIVALEFQDTYNFIYKNQTKQGLGQVRQLGFEISSGNYVAYLDDDAIPSTNWLRKILQIILDQQPDCICGPIFPYYEGDKPDWFLDEFEIRSKGTDQRLLRPGEECSGSNMVWNREILEELGGFNIDLGMVGDQIAGGEDADLFRRFWAAVRGGQFSGEVVYSPEVIVNHWTPEYKMHVGYYLKRNYAAGIAAARMRNDDPLYQKFAQIIRMSAEIGFVLLMMPFIRWKYKYSEIWQINELRKVYFRLGWIGTYLGISKNPNT